MFKVIFKNFKQFRSLETSPVSHKRPHSSKHRKMFLLSHGYPMPSLSKSVYDHCILNDVCKTVRKGSPFKLRRDQSGEWDGTWQRFSERDWRVSESLESYWWKNKIHRSLNGGLKCQYQWKLSLPCILDRCDLDDKPMIWWEKCEY